MFPLGYCTWNISQLDRKSSDQQNVGSLLVRFIYFLLVLLNFFSCLPPLSIVLCVYLVCLWYHLFGTQIFFFFNSVTLVTVLGRGIQFMLVIYSWSSPSLGHIQPEPWPNFPCCPLLGQASHCSGLGAGKYPREPPRHKWSCSTIALLYRKAKKKIPCWL